MPASNGSKIEGLRHPVAVWFGSFGLASSVLLMAFHVPLTPVLLAGAVTLGLTIARSLSSSRTPPRHT